MRKLTTLTAVGIAALGLIAGTTGTAIAGKLIDSADVRNNSLRSVDVQDGTLGLRDLNKYTKAKVTAPGKAGADGADGRDGVDGKDGADGVSGYHIEGPEARWSNTAGTVVAACPAGKVALGGGFTVEGIRGGSATVTSSAPVYVSQTEASGWKVTGTATGEANVKAWAICATVN